MTIQETDTETTTVVAKKERKQVAEHALIDAGGNAVETEEEASGIRYTLLENGEVFVWQWADATEAERKLVGLFGAKTLATNETSQARNNPKGSATADEQIAAVRERFALIRDGKWVDRSGGGVGTRINREQLASAVCKVLVDNGKKTQDEIDNGYWATVRQRLDDDAEWLAKMRKYPPVAAAYALLVGKDTGTTVDNMMD
jgi:hypothetical protein